MSGSSFRRQSIGQVDFVSRQATSQARRHGGLVSQALCGAGVAGGR